MLLSVLNLGVFLLPAESGEKVSLCISIVLSYAVFLTVISESLPEVSDTVSIFAVYLLTMLFLKVMTTLATVVILHVYHSEIRRSSFAQSDIVSPDKDLALCSDFEPNMKLPASQAYPGGSSLAKSLNRYCFGACIVFTLLITLVSFVCLLM